MIRSLPRSKAYDWSFTGFIVLYFSFLFAPLLVTCVLAFNDSNFPSLPWQGFTLDWFFANGPERIGLFHDDQNLLSLVTSFQTAFFVSILSVIVGTCASFLFERQDFRFLAGRVRTILVHLDICHPGGFGTLTKIRYLIRGGCSQSGCHTPWRDLAYHLEISSSRHYRSRCSGISNEF